MFALTMTSLLLWLVILLLPWRPWDVSESLDAALSEGNKLSGNSDNKQQKNESLVQVYRAFSSITVLIPARNEGIVIRETLLSIADQAPCIKIILIDDQSTDDTIHQAQSLNLKNLQIISGRPLLKGWSGKLWALQQGLALADTELILLLDADIALKPGTLSTLCHKFESEELDLLSLMAHLKMEGFWEKLLMPAFIHFFKLLYPFKLSNCGHPAVAAAAGGCILVKRVLLEEVGAFDSLRSALIDDCSLARKARDTNKKTWIGLTHSAISLRSYNHLEDIWNMVSRTAYTQLKYSPSRLVFCTLLMLLVYIIPILAIVHFPGLALIILILMAIIYSPTILYYNLTIFWILGLPIAGALYMLMTWTSAYRFYRGERSQWKGRSYS